jgi:hypothetical protein
MFIEHMTDRNMTTTGEMDPQTKMIDLQHTLVTDHIHDLEREGEALRAERLRDCLQADGIALIAAPSRRVRIGRWLVAVGEAIAGPTDGPSVDGTDRLSPAA